MVARLKSAAFGIGITLLLVFGHYRDFPRTSYALNAQPARSVAFSTQQSSVERAAAWLVRTHQNDDGGYASFSTGAGNGASSPGGTFDAILALSAAGYPVGVPYPGETNAPLDYFRQDIADVVAFAEEDGGQAGKAVLALAAAGESPSDFAGHDFVAVLVDHLEPDGAFGAADPFKQSLAILGLAAAGEPIPTRSVEWLKSQQGASGAWGDGFGTDENTDATALAVMALIAAGESGSSAALAEAVDFLDVSQTPAGWEYGPGFGASANSTALVIQALSALGQRWHGPDETWAVGGRAPLDMLLAFQSGAGAFQSDFGQGPFDDFFATVQSLPAVTGKSYPLPASGVAVDRALACLERLQDPATGGWEQFAASGINAGGTARAIEAIVAAGEEPDGVRWSTADGTSPIDALEMLTPAYLDENLGGRIGIVMQGVAAAGPPLDVADFGGEDLAQRMNDVLSSAGEYDSTAFGIFAHAEAMLGLQAARERVAPQSISLLLSKARYGSWGDADSNGLALQVLGGLGWQANPGTLVALRASQSADGGWGFEGTTNPSSSAEVVQGLSAVGQNPFGPRWSRVRDGITSNAADATLAQQGENGCWPNAFAPGDDVYGTVDAILLLSQRPGWGPYESSASVTRGGR